MPQTGQPIIIKGDQITWDARLDRVKQIDLRSLAYSARDILEGVALQRPRSYRWYVDERLDQGQEGACVGFGWAHELAARPAEVVGITNAFARNRIYHPAQRIDEWEGGAYDGASPFYEGTSVLAGAKIVKSLGFIDEYRWCLTFDDLIATVGYKGPVVIGVDWYDGMANTDAQGFIHPTGRIRGGHCVAIVGVKIFPETSEPGWDEWRYNNIDYLRSYFLILNSWGTNWGQNGYCKISFAGMMKLWPGGDFAAPVGRQKVGVEL